MQLKLLCTTKVDYNRCTTSLTQYLIIAVELDTFIHMHAPLISMHTKFYLAHARVPQWTNGHGNACVREASNVRMYAWECTARAPASSRTGTQHVRVWGR